MADPEDIRKLARRLDARRENGGRLTPPAMAMAAQALHVYADMIERSARDADLAQPFIVEVVDAAGHCEELLAKCSHVSVARAAHAEACRQRPRRDVVLRHGARVIERVEQRRDAAPLGN